MPKITKAHGATHNPRPTGKGAATPPAPPASANSQEQAVPTPERPSKSAVVADWRAYAEAVGVDPDGLTKKQLIAATEDV